MEKENSIPFLLLEGEAYENGFKIGSILKNEINEFLGSDLAGVGKNKEQVEIILKPYYLYLNERHPSLIDEISGLANGANITFYTALMLQYRRELTRDKSLDCSLIAIKGFNNILAQTIDLSGTIGNYGVVTKIVTPNEPIQLLYTFAGLLGYLGLNSNNIAIGINMVFSKDWQVGISPYLLIRELLRLKSIDECINYLKKIKISSSRSLTLIDEKQLVNIEISPTKELSIKYEDKLSHTNHFIHENMLCEEDLNIFSVNSSKKRHDRLKTLFDENEFKFNQNKDKDHEWIFDNIFSDHEGFPTSICNHVNHSLYPKTVASVVIDINMQTLRIRKGLTCENKTIEFKI